MKQLRGAFYIMLIFLVFISLTGCSKEKRKEVSGRTAGAVNPVTEAAENRKAADFGDQDIIFSKKAYFYAEDTPVEILIRKPGKIYYTTDGSEPDTKQNRYREAIKLIANQDTKANCIKAKAYFDDGTESDTIVHTYFVGKNVKTRFDTLIFAVSTDPYNLYDYEYGIFVEGKLRDDYIKDHPDAKIDPSSPANYNMRGKESERKVYLEVFEPEGTRIVSQTAGIRTYGGWSRAREQKSIKLFARKEYDEENNKIRYSFFPNRINSKNQVIDTFKQLVLRNCGNDNGFAFIRDELFQTLAGQAGYQDYEAVRPAAVFVNGEYRGFFWLHEVYCKEYFEDHYGRYNGSFEILEGGETTKNVEADGENAEAVREYEEMYTTYSTLDLTKDENYKKLCGAVDVDNYLSYYALQIYIGNEDWPHNNYKTYRYYVEEGEEYREAPFDGKWRYLLHDLDYSSGIYGTGAKVDNIQNYIGENGEVKDTCPLFGRLMQRADCREIFLKKTLDLLNGAFAPDHFNSVLDEMNTARLNELKHTYNKGLLENWVAYSQLEGRLQTLKNYASLRANHILTKYQEYFGLGDIYRLVVKPVEGCKVKINTFETKVSFEGSYFTDFDTLVKAAEIPEGKEFDYWLVNGEKVKDRELIVKSSMVRDGKVEVTLILK